MPALSYLRLLKILFLFMTFCHASWANSNIFTPTEDELFQGNLGALYSPADRFVTATYPYEIIGGSNSSLLNTLIIHLRQLGKFYI